MTWQVPIVLGGLAVLVMMVFTVLSARKHHRAVVLPATVLGERFLVHDINDDRCTGCDACVAVCPTNVLDLVANKSRVLRFQDCIQCEACMVACPTEALVMFPQGGTPPPLKVPELDENFQTVVSGQYLIGEVAGKPLVKNAANLGRVVIEHMLSTGLRSAGSNAIVDVDVAIVGSGPGGLSAALSCIQRGLSYVVLEKEHVIASTIARYPKGKLVMAEPYDTANLSLLPIFDASKEQLIPIWQELFNRVGLTVRCGESVESVKLAEDGCFDIRTLVSTIRAQRVVLSIGTRGKPRTLQVPGENLPHVFSLLEDPDAWSGRRVVVVGGGDSACEAALALADSGANVIISYRGKSFNRASPRNKQSIEAYAAEGRLRAKLGSQVLSFAPGAVTIALGDGSQHLHPNDAAFVLIGAEPPIAWLERLGIRFVERPHSYQLGRTEELVRRFLASAIACPEEAARASTLVTGGELGPEPAPEPIAPPIVPAIEASTSGPRKWLQSATSLFSPKQHAPPPRVAPVSAPTVMLKVNAPRSFGPAQPGSGMHHTHSGHGRRDQLDPQERTRVLRMLRDEGDPDEGGVFIGAAPSGPSRSAAPPHAASRQRAPLPGVPRQTMEIPTLPTDLDQDTVFEQAPKDRRWLAEPPATEPDAPGFDDDDKTIARLDGPQYDLD